MSGKFLVVSNVDHKTYTVYDVRYDPNGYPLFLIYDDKQWLLRNAKHFHPVI